jgi:uncharacterized membrane protein YebE (DUF533 family)
MKRIEAEAMRFGAVLLVAGCAAQPLRPSVAVMPAPNKPFEVFQQDQAACQQYAYQQVGGPQAANAANNQFAAGATFGTLLGAAVGALLTGSGQGAASGAAVGLLAGSAIGANNAGWTAQDVQWEYDTAYRQCMYARGDQVPGYQSETIPPPPPPPSLGE